MMAMPKRKPMSRWPRTALCALLIGVLASPAAYAAWSWPFSSSKTRHPGKTVHSSVQHAVRPLGHPPKTIKPIGSNRAPPKTILAKRPY
jgi:hypothetical protein